MELLVSKEADETTHHTYHSKKSHFAKLPSILCPQPHISKGLCTKCRASLQMPSRAYPLPA